MLRRLIQWLWKYSTVILRNVSCFVWILCLWKHLSLQNFANNSLVFFLAINLKLATKYDEGHANNMHDTYQLWTGCSGFDYNILNIGLFDMNISNTLNSEWKLRWILPWNRITRVYHTYQSHIPIIFHIIIISSRRFHFNLC